MPRSSACTYSRYTLDAVALLGGLIRSARKRSKLTTQDVADRAGISRGLLQRIEKGDPKCEIGATFEVATVVGVPLFGLDAAQLAQARDRTEEALPLLPESIRKPAESKVFEDF